MTTQVSFELAKLLKEKGFNGKSFGRYYTLNGVDWNFAEANDYFRLDDEIEIGANFTILAPTIAEVVMWLYKKHSVWIVAWRYFDDPKKFYFEIDSKGDVNLGLFNSPTEAYEAAILYTLNNLI